MVIFCCLTVFDDWYTAGTVKTEKKTIGVPIVTGLPRVYHQCTNSMPIVKNSQKTVKTFLASSCGLSLESYITCLYGLVSCEWHCPTRSYSAFTHCCCSCPVVAIGASLPSQLTSFAVASSAATKLLFYHIHFIISRRFWRTSTVHGRIRWRFSLSFYASSSSSWRWWLWLLLQVQVGEFVVCASQ